jgi:hypothetical protein
MELLQVQFAIAKDNVARIANEECYVWMTKNSSPFKRGKIKYSFGINL